MPKQDPTVPFSIRLTQAEHATLKRRSGTISMASYARMKLLSADETARRTPGKVLVADRQALAKLLGLIGRAEFAACLKDIANAVRLGVLALTPETEQAIQAACQATVDMKRMLMKALGIRER